VTAVTPEPTLLPEERARDISSAVVCSRALRREPDLETVFTESRARRRMVRNAAYAVEKAWPFCHPCDGAHDGGTHG
jgi:hypothetical protein